MSSDNNRHPAPPAAPEAGTEASRRDAPPAGDPSPASEDALSPLPSHSLFRPDREDDIPAAPRLPEDDPSPHEEEDDHSMTELDLDGEIKAAPGKVPAPAAASAPPEQTRENAPAVDHDYFPEDERSSMDWENDSSTADFDLNAEIEAKLGKAPPLPPAGETAPPCPVPAGADLAAPLEQYFPEDERSSPDWEDDHSMTSFDADAEVTDRLDKTPSSPAAPAGDRSSQADGRTDGAGQDKAYYPEDEHSSMDWEGDHSATDFDLNTEGTSAFGSPGKNGPNATESDSEGYIHPDLAASLNASLAYAQRGLATDDEDRDSNPEDKSRSAPSTEEAPAGDAPADRQEKKRPFDKSGADASGRTDLAENAPAVVGNAPPAPVPGNGDEGSDEEEEEEEEEEEDSGLGRPMSLRDHLTELRKRITWAFIWAIVGFIICYPFAEELFRLLLAPLTRVLPSAGHLIFTSPPEAFFTYMKVAFVAGVFLTSPLVFYQIWAFIAPGLYREEKVHILPIAFFSALFFILGGAFCYFITFPFAFEFFMSFSTDVIVAMPALNESLSFVLQLLLAFGLVFELPLFVFFLSRLGLVTADMMRKFRRYAILANVIVAAILTPPDVMSQLLMAGPLILLYELSILIAAVFGKKKEKPADDNDEEEEENEEDEGEDDAARPAPQT